MTKAADLALEKLGRFVGDWVTEATHPMMPDTIVHGSATIEWLEGERFLIQRSRNEHPRFPDGIWIIGYTDRDRVDGSEAGDQPMTCHYFDSRGVFRVFSASVDDGGLEIWRDSPGFSQRLHYKLDEDVITGTSELNEHDEWKPDLEITYRRRR